MKGTSNPSVALLSLAAVAVVFVVLGLLQLHLHDPRIRWDGTFYFITLRSLTIDGDLDFANEAERLPWMAKDRRARHTPTGRFGNPMPVGTSLLWSPFYVAADLWCRWVPGAVRDGYSPPYVHAVLLASAFWGALGLVLGALTLRRLSGGRWGTAVLTVTLLACTSSLPYYCVLQADYSHACSYFAVSLLLLLVVSAPRNHPVSWCRWLGLGLALGLVVLVRWQDVWMALLLLPLLIPRGPDPTPRLRALAGAAVPAAVGFLAVVWLQIAFWWLLYGRLVTDPHGPGYLKLRADIIIPFFLSTWNGVFLFHPVLLVALVALALRPAAFYPAWPGNGRALRLVIPVIFALESLTSMLPYDWWAGGGFGQRRLVSVLPLMAVGLCHLLNLVRESRSWAPLVAACCLAALLVAWNGLLLIRGHQGAVPLNPADPQQYASATPFDRFDYRRFLHHVVSGERP
jgi:hypothetical protein